MGVTYKLKDEVVQFIISKRQHNPLFSCRQLAEAASIQFGLQLSKSSVHDVLKESGVVTPRGRKPKNTFKIPEEKKKQIQESLLKVTLQEPVDSPPALMQPTIETQENSNSGFSDASPPSSPNVEDSALAVVPVSQVAHDIILPKLEKEIYEDAGKIFLKAALWDLGIFNKDIIVETPFMASLKEEEWSYYLTYTSAIRVFLQNNTSYTIEWRMPLQRSIREVADCFINNVKPFIVSETSDDQAFKSSMDAREGFKIKNIEIVDEKYHVMFNFVNIMDYKRNFLIKERLFMESYEKEANRRYKKLFLSQIIDNESDIDKMMHFKGFNTENDEELCVNLLIPENENKEIFQSAMNTLNNMCIRDEKNRLLCVKSSVTA